MPLDDEGPRLRQVLVIDGQRWFVIGRSTYGSTQGYEAVEWECERDGARDRAWLLRESDDGVRWLFTRPVPLAEVTLSGGRPLAEGGTPAQPPDALLHRGQAYGFDEATEGVHEDEDGSRAPKITWDYWDAAHTRNLAVELRADEAPDCYVGRVVDPSTIMVDLAAARRPPSMARLLGLLLLTGPIAFVVLVVVAGSVETGLTALLALVTLAAVVRGARQSRPLALVGLVAAAFAGLLFFEFPPLTTPAGVVTLLVVPAALAWWSAMRPPEGSPVFAIAAFTAAAALGAGLVTYYRFAPAPRTFGDFVVAVGPAAIAAVVGALVAWLALRLVPSR